MIERVGKVGVLGILVVFAIAVAASAAPARSTGSPIVIGSVIGLTGFMAPYDQPAANFAKLAVKDVNAKGGIFGHPLKMTYFDQKSDAATGATAANQAISAGAKVLIVGCDYDQGSPAASVALQKGLVAISTCAGDPKFGPQGIGPNAYTLGNASSTTGAGEAEWTFQKKHWKTAYELEDTSLGYSTTLCSGWQQRFKQLSPNGLLGSDTFKNSDTSIATQITRIRALQTQPSYIMLCSYIPGEASAIKQIRDAGITAPIVCGESADGSYWWNTVPSLTNVYVSTYNYIFGPVPHNPTWNRTLVAYKKTFHVQPPSSQGATGYALIQVLAAALKRTHGSTNATALENALNQTNMNTVIGPTKFTKTLHIAIDRTQTIYEIRNKKAKYLGTWRAQKPPMP